MYEDHEYEFWYDNYEWFVAIHAAEGRWPDPNGGYGADYYNHFFDYEYLAGQYEGCCCGSRYCGECGGEADPCTMPDDHILHSIFECRPGYHFNAWVDRQGAFLRVAYDKSGPHPLRVNLYGSSLELSFLQTRVEVDLNDHASCDVIQRFLDAMPSVCRYFGPAPIRFRSTEEALA